MDQVQAFVRTEHAGATLKRSAVEYQWIWDPVTERWYMKCTDPGVVTYALDEDSPPVEIQVEIVARY